MTTSHSAAVVEPASQPDRDSPPANESSRDSAVGQSPKRDRERETSDHDAGRERSPATPHYNAASAPVTAPASVPSSAPAAAPTSAPASASAAATPTAAAQRSSTLLEPDPSHELLVAAFRKTSPGLAARLKALGLGAASKRATVSSQPVDIGRLDEEQLRQLDEKHQANSKSAVISRRGRPWKGAGAPPPNHYRSTSQSDVSMSPGSADIYQLPDVQEMEVPQSPPNMDMDTQKYRLPDHINGNGTKVTLDTRREHLERITRPPSPKEYPPLPSSPPEASLTNSPMQSLSYSPSYSPSPPTPPPKESPPVEITPPEVITFNHFEPEMSSYFTQGHGRPGSIYTLSRASFANQLAQLNMLGIPDAEALASKVSAIPTAPVATKALINAAEQIRSWISKALEVVSGLDSEDDVEWAAAGGREGLEEVENAISRFEHLINAYVNAIDELQNRPDIPTVSTDDLNRAVAQMEAIAEEWGRIKHTLQNVRNQVEIAMEWEELWNSVLGDIQGELDELGRLVFEMEERRHKSLAVAASGDNVDIGDLETIVEDNPLSAARLQPSNRFSLALPMSPNSGGASTLSQDDSSLLALFARMQPLRASLDFLPMRLSSFEARAKGAFPTACEELEMRREGLDGSYHKLEKDAESLRKELGEDRWVIVFRGAGRQAQKMHESVERSLMKLREAIEAGMHLTNQPAIAKKIESYEAKKTHYGPAIERVLAIIDKGVKDRLTVNGEILRLHAEMQTRWETLKADMAEMDLVLEEINAERKSQQLRDSVSSMLSNDRSTSGSGMETPGSSPPSSVVMSSFGLDPHTPARKHRNPLRSPNASSSSVRSTSTNRRDSSLPAPVSKLSKKPGNRQSYYPPSASSSTLRPASTMGQRPRWNSSSNALDAELGRSPHRTPVPQRSTTSITPISTSKLPTPRSSQTRTGAESPMSDAFPRSWSRNGHSRLSFRERLTSPGPYSQTNLAKQQPARRSNVLPTSSNLTLDSLNTRPSSSMATSRRSSLLPTPRGRTESARGTSPLPIFSRFSSRKYSDNSPEPKDLKPRWRF
ncbi:KAR9-domain-containing protein [Trichoderma citrinoviride]|uniref:KAR9-domain-containing protein n=1 Tax=Trichoderma citrinoviride TaxID=58853 RepID=A0A2T4B138_9HYPO|nr:KAR9-domain-containing protein [Trichoderma citrinoviride]PTB62948.1 KAR9-domain-containing protein [Trichoderma citrinoviride]